jgi:hypothetical protein
MILSDMPHDFSNQFFTNFLDTSYITKCVSAMGLCLQGTKMGEFTYLETIK